MDIFYATIPIFRGEYKILYIKVQLAYLVSGNKNPTNNPIYLVKEDFFPGMLHRNDDATCILQVEKDHTLQPKMEDKDCLWQMYFDGSSCKERAGASIVLISPGGEIISLMYKLEF